MSNQITVDYKPDVEYVEVEGAPVTVVTGQQGVAGPSAPSGATISYVIDGGGIEITTGLKGVLEIPFPCIIDKVTVLGDQVGSIVIDIWKEALADYPPTIEDSIVASAKPTLAGELTYQDTDLTGWDTAINTGDVLAFFVESVEDCTRVTISLKVSKT